MTTLAPVQAHAAPQRRLWLITFVDLVMLLLAFFVLLFSMSSLNAEKYGAVARAYAATFNPLGGTESVTIGPQRIPAPTRTPGDDLAYLETVLKTAFVRDPRLADIQFRLTTQYLILELPLAAASDEGWVLDEPARQQVFDVGGVLSNLPNRIAVVVPVTAGGDGRAAWGFARAQAQLVRQALISAGYPGPVTALARGTVTDPMAAPAAPSVQILVMPEAEAHS
jgi:chemotaxis protein MotB